ncbi:hypothetical protein SUDANB121_02259 [Nocardiopsis dassonvillei]|uniref:glycosyltransferase n=1 Tax=Nocardiopsis dassonvillei TaxID=2014 RepID=UPI003F57AE49
MSPAERTRLAGFLGRGPVLVCRYGGEGGPPPSRLPGNAVFLELEALIRGDRPAFDGGSAYEQAMVIVPGVLHLRALAPHAHLIPPVPRLSVLIGALLRPGSPLPAFPPSLPGPELLDFRGRVLPCGGRLVEFVFDGPAPTAEVIAGVARGALGGRRGAPPLPVGRALGPDAGSWRPGEPFRTPAEPLDLTLLTGADTRDDDVRTPHLGRHSGAELSWGSVGRAGTDIAPLRSLSVGDVPPVDERVVNPVGFVRGCSSVVGRLVCRGGRWVLVAGGRERWRVPDDGTVTDVDVASVRDLRAVRVEWGRHSGPLAAVRAVAALAVAGVPVVSSGVPLWAGCLGGPLVGLMGSVSVAGLADAQVREEFSVRLRRAALGSHSVAARWRGLAVEAGSGPVPVASVSVVLCTRRPEMVGFALRQVGRQRGVDVEVVLALHGFGVDAPGVREAVEGFRASGGRLVVWEAGGDVVFGAVLNGAVARASGSLVAKMDDDDWYGPDHLSDLVWARRYSGADLVGTAAEFVYLEALDATVRLVQPTECTWHTAAGGTLFTDRRTLEEAGGFPEVPTGEDTRLNLAICRMGGRIHRGHGGNYVLRRKASGHTWSVGSGYFLRHGGERLLPGWRPSSLLEAGPGEGPPGARRVDPWTAGEEPARRVPAEAAP